MDHGVIQPDCQDRKFHTPQRPDFKPGRPGAPSGASLGHCHYVTAVNGFVTVAAVGMGPGPGWPTRTRMCGRQHALGERD